MGGSLAAVALLFLATGLIVDGPLRSAMEGRLNRNLHGYTARLAATDFHPIGFALDLQDLVIVQDAAPDLPVLRIERVHARVHWRALLRLRLVGDCSIQGPAIRLDRRHAQLEHRDTVPIQDRGWQDALQSIYPLKFNQIRVERGAFSYLDREHTRPLELHEITLRASNIRNIKSRDRTYPSEVSCQAVVFDRGRLTCEGNADFLAKPHVGVQGRVELADIVLDYFQPILEDMNLVVRQGSLDAQGTLEYAPTVRTIDLEDLVVHEPDVEYVHRDRPGRDGGAAARAVDAARTPDDGPSLQFVARRVRIENGTLSWTNRTTNPPYRLFVRGTQLDLHDVSNQRDAAPGTAELTGSFMGGGKLAAAARYRRGGPEPDFDLKLRVQGTPLVSLNDMLRAHGRLDVVRGSFSLFTEVQVQNGRIRGYVKPLFKDVDIYDSKQDHGFFSRIWEAIAGAAATLLSNRERDEVATVTDISGPLADPKTSAWQIVGNLLKNAFFEAIIPGFDREVETRK